MRSLWVPLVAICAAALSACGGLPGSTTDDQVVNVTMTEYTVQLGTDAVPAGKVTFRILNEGTVKHEFVILRTDLAVTALPSDPATNKVQEEATGIQHVDEIDGVDAGQQRDLTVDLKAGRYLLVCNYPGHVHAGMTAFITVT
jgi:uncharacterized cupredoxin-like copper-binding protein